MKSLENKNQADNVSDVADKKREKIKNFKRFILVISQAKFILKTMESRTI